VTEEGAVRPLTDRAGEWLLRRVPPLRRSLDQVTLHAAAWTEENERALAGDPAAPLWVVLGDSTAQAIGLADHQAGYVGRVRGLLEQRDGRPWRVLNLSRSGAVVADVLDTQLPALRAAGAVGTLTSAVVGGNDLRRTPTPLLLTGLRDLVGALPSGALVATMPRGLKEDKARAANRLLRALAPEQGLLVADLWARTGPPWRGKYADGLHPNAAGVTDWVAAIADALGLPAEQDPPYVRPRSPRRDLPRRRGRVAIRLLRRPLRRGHRRRAWGWHPLWRRPGGGAGRR